MVPEELVGVYSNPYKNDIVLFFRARVIAQNPWQPNDEIAQMGYFSRDDLPEPMGLVARTRVIDALDDVTGIVHVMHETAAQ